MPSRSWHLIGALLVVLAGCVSTGRAGRAIVQPRVLLKPAAYLPLLAQQKNPNASVPNPNQVVHNPNSQNAYKSTRAPNDTINQPQQPGLVVKFRVDNAKPQIGEEVHFQVEIPPQFANCRSLYALSFGDGQTTQVSASLIPHQYKEAGRHFARLTKDPAGGRFCGLLKVEPEGITLTVQTAPPISPTPTPPSTPIETVTSPTPFESPTPTPPIDSHDETNTGLIDWLNPRKSWWLYLLVLAFAFVSYRSVKAALTPRPSFSSHLDAGGADVDEGTQPLAIESQVILTPHIADAEYKVKPDDASLIGSVRRDDV